MSWQKKMERYLNYKNRFYIEMGANNGISQSNTMFLEKKYNWHGMLIEPSGKFFIKNTKTIKFLMQYFNILVIKYI
jgi:hypothetical protein